MKIHILLFLASITFARAELITLAWDASTSPDATRYHLMERTTAGDVTITTTGTTGGAPALTASFNAAPGQHVYFVTAQADDGRESVPSNMLVVTVAAPPLAPPSALRKVQAPQQPAQK